MGISNPDDHYDIGKGERIVLHLLAIPVSIVAMIWSAYVTSTIWNWFAVPIFNAPELTTLKALALGCVVGAFTFGFARKGDLRSITKNPSDALERTAFGLIEAFLIPAALLGVGWIIKSFMS